MLDFTASVHCPNTKATVLLPAKGPPLANHVPVLPQWYQYAFSVHRVCLQLREKFLKDEDMSDTKATYRSIRKALATLNDPFTRFLEPAQFAALRRGTAGAVTGVGLEIGFESRDIDSRVVVRPCTQQNIRFSLQ